MSGWEQWALIAGQSLVAIVQAVVIVRLSRDKAIRRAAQRTPEMEHVARLDTQLYVIRARGRITLAGWRQWFRLVEPSYFVDPYLNGHPLQETSECELDPTPPCRLPVSDTPEVRNAAA